MNNTPYITLNLSGSSHLTLPGNLSPGQVIRVKVASFKPKTRSILQYNSSMRNYWKKNLFKSFNGIDNILSAGSSYTNRKILSPSEIDKLSKARDLVRDVIENYKKSILKIETYLNKELLTYQKKLRNPRYILKMVPRG